MEHLYSNVKWFTYNEGYIQHVNHQSAAFHAESCRERSTCYQTYSGIIQEALKEANNKTHVLFTYCLWSQGIKRLVTTLVLTRLCFITNWNSLCLIKNGNKLQYVSIKSRKDHK